MGDGTAFVGLDVHKETIAVAIAEDGRGGEMRFLGEIANSREAIKAACYQTHETTRHVAFLL